jgi:hypothetical protein
LVRLTRTVATAFEHLEDRVEHAQAALLEPLPADERRGHPSSASHGTSNAE